MNRTTLRNVVFSQIPQRIDDIRHVRHKFGKVVNHSDVTTHFFNIRWFSHFSDSLDFFRVTLQSILCYAMPDDSYFARTSFSGQLDAVASATFHESCQVAVMFFEILTMDNYAICNAHDTWRTVECLQNVLLE